MRQESLTAVRTASLGIVLACGLATAWGDVVAPGRGTTGVEIVDLSKPAARAPMMRVPARAGVGQLLIEARDLKKAEAPARRELMRDGPKVYYGRSTTVKSSVVVILDESVTTLRGAKNAISGALSSPPAAPGSARVTHIDEMPGNWVLVKFDTVGEAIDSLEALESIEGVQKVELEVDVPRQSYALPTDPYVQYQWHLNNTLMAGADINVEPVWDSGITGAGVTIGVMDAGEWNMQLSHPDLADNIKMDLVQTYSAFPEVDHYGIGDHATAVAGIIAGEANNAQGISGIAYDAQLAAMVHTGTAATISTGLSYKNKNISIKNHSWGFPTEQAVFEEFGTLTPPFPINVMNSITGGPALDTISTALTRTYIVNNQKQVFSAGNGNLHESFPYWLVGNAIQTDEDGAVYDVGFNADLSDASVTFASSPPYSLGERTEYSRFTKWRNSIVIGGIGEDNDHTWYSTSGCNVLAVAYTEGADVAGAGAGSSGAWDFSSRSMVTASEVDTYTDAAEYATHPSQTAPNAIYPGGAVVLPDGYTAVFNGTSAAAPVATGIIGLMLDANPNLSIRDIKRIIQATADWTRIQPTPDVPDLNSDGNDDWTTIEEELGATASSDSYYGDWTFWQVNGANVPHSDQYGFGVIDAEAAVNMARNYHRPQLIIADSGILEVEDGEIEDATYEELVELQSLLVPGAAHGFSFCVPSNLLVEDVELTMSVEGRNPGDLRVWLISPEGSVSNLLYPRVDNQVYNLGGTDYALYRYRVNTLKHWGELSGGVWTVWFQDWRPDDELPSGDQDDADPPNTVPHSIDLGRFGLPSFTDETGEKTVTELKLTVYGTSSGMPGYDYCGLISPSCPGDVNADGRVNLDDLQSYIDLWLAGDPIADLTGDGVIDYSDLLAFFGAWSPGYCSSPADRPVDNDIPADRPIQGQF